MNVSLVRFVRIIAFLSIAASASMFSPHVLAQAKPALIRDIDEPGRNPYQKSISLVQGPAAGCTTLACFFVFDTVPAGKRLVITYVSAGWGLASGGTGASAIMYLDGTNSGPIPFLVAPVNVGLNFYVLGGPVTFYAEPGYTPTVVVGGQFLNPGITATAHLTGYFVSLP
jgi:hypothetical protein